MEQDRDDRAARRGGPAAAARHDGRGPVDRLLALDEPASDAAADERSDAGTGQRSDAGTGLTERDRAVLAFERQWWKVPGSKERAIREHFDLSATRYYQLLNALVDTDDAVRHDPMLVKRLRRARAERLRGRTVRRLGLGRPD